MASARNVHHTSFAITITTTGIAAAVTAVARCRRQEDGEKELCEVEMTEDVGPELEIVPVYCGLSVSEVHKPGVVNESIESILLATNEHVSLWKGSMGFNGVQ